MKINSAGQTDNTYSMKSKITDGNDIIEIKDSFAPSDKKTEGGDLDKIKLLRNNMQSRVEKNSEGKETQPAPVPASSDQLAGQLEAYIAKIMSDPQAEAEMIKMLAKLNATGQLRPVLQMAALKATEAGSLPTMPEQKRKDMVDQLAGMIDAEFRSHGMTLDTMGKVHKDWETMGKEHLALVRNSKIAPRGPGKPSAFTEPEFLKELETLQGASFRPGNKITPLINGPASFAERNRLIDGAKKSIHMMTWAFYDDETGWDTAKKLVSRKNDNLDVQTVVDGQVGSRFPHMETLKYMEDNKLPLIRWGNPDEPYQGQHRKMFMVDGESAILGGMNPGNDYSHMGPADGAKWRDTDVLLKGPAVADCERIFASVCGRKEEDIPIPQVAGGASVAAVNHSPGADSNIMLATMKAIEGASESIDIENAYFIQTPGIKEVLLDALKRGVKVRLLTNSAESIDEQIVSAPILRSLPELLNAGAEIYLKKGDTLHSKFMVVDGMYTSIGSYNLHPRSEIYEGEVVLNVLDKDMADTLDNVFEDDIAKATRVMNADQIVVPQNIMTIIPERYFFDQL